MKITKKTKIFEIIQRYPETAGIFSELGLRCFNCPLAASETIEDISLIHGINCMELIKKIEKKIKKTK